MHFFKRPLLYLVLTLIVGRAFAQADDAPSLIKQAVQLNKDGKYADAVDKYRQSLKLDSANVYANYGIAYSLLALGKGDEGIPYLQKVILSKSSLTAWAYDLLGSIYDKDHDSAKAIAAFNEGIKPIPNTSGCIITWGWFIFATENMPMPKNAPLKLLSSTPSTQTASACMPWFVFTRIKGQTPCWVFAALSCWSRIHRAAPKRTEISSIFCRAASSSLPRVKQQRL